MDFNVSIFENRKRRTYPFLVAHRGVCGANIPCNTLAAYKIALDQGADVVEIDVSKSKDGVFYVFHPGMEHVFLQSNRQISEMTSEEVDALFLVNQDAVKTSYKVPRLSEVLALLKDKVYINVDKFWTDVEGISNEIRKAGVEKQVIVKTWVDEKALEAVRKHAPDFMFIPLVLNEDKITESPSFDGINLIGVEALFREESAPCCSPEYIEKMHSRGLLVWSNAIIYNEADVISAHRTDDLSLSTSADLGWGWLIDRGFDFIQTDWLLMIKSYIDKRQVK
ncbi:MAG: glycerophosphodiester phosphodiesterase family protein [Clostridia bacterium]|nr:glycerophosphodiester phosphodiesterase family protein [Clostridia bacterium]